MLKTNLRDSIFYKIKALTILEDKAGAMENTRYLNECFNPSIQLLDFHHASAARIFKATTIKVIFNCSMLDSVRTS